MLFWACVVGLLAGTGSALQIMGPLPPNNPVKLQAARVPHAQPQSAMEQPNPAHVPAGKPDPAPALKMALTAIPEPDPILLEKMDGLPDRMLPKADGSGRLPATVYAASFDPAERHPRVTLVIDGAGLDRALTAEANRTLPAAIDFAFSAYAPAKDAAKLAREGRRLGRECLVSIPMEPNGYPANDEGTRALLTGAEPEQTRQNLNWALSSVAGCVGATGASDGMGGERFAESQQALGDMLTAIAQRGLIYLDPRPGAPLPQDAVAGRKLPYVADVLIDHADDALRPADAQSIDRSLAQLEQVAAHRGGAIGIAGPPTPVLLDRVALWAHGLAARGLVLAPLTANQAPLPPLTDPLR